MVGLLSWWLFMFGLTKMPFMEICVICLGKQIQICFVVRFVDRTASHWGFQQIETMRHWTMAMIQWLSTYLNIPANFTRLCRRYGSNKRSMSGGLTSEGFSSWRPFTERFRSLGLGTWCFHSLKPSPLGKDYGDRSVNPSGQNMFWKVWNQQLVIELKEVDVWLAGRTVQFWITQSRYIGRLTESN